jgi:hypothetical protein
MSAGAALATALLHGTCAVSEPQAKAGTPGTAEAVTVFLAGQARILGIKDRVLVQSRVILIFG